MSALDEKTQKSIERRRQAEAERKERIFNVKQRTLGVDTAALEQQIAEKKEREQREKTRDAAFERQKSEVERQLLLMEHQHELQKREVAKEVEQFRKECQHKEESRDYDLIDPTTLKSSSPLNPDVLTISSLQKFDGEDLAAKERKKAQQEQLRKWIEQQKAEKAETHKMEEELERLHALREREITERTKEMETLYQQTRRAMVMATRDYNKAMADAKLEADKEELIARTLQGLDDMQNQLQSDFLCENPETAVSCSDPNRVITMNFKGMSQSQKHAILEQQKEQARIKEQEQKEAEEQKRRWEQQEVAIMRAALLREREIERQRREISKQCLEENKVAAVEQAHKLQQLDETYANKITPQFFEQFGTSSR